MTLFSCLMEKITFACPRISVMVDDIFHGNRSSSSAKLAHQLIGCWPPSLYASSSPGVASQQTSWYDQLQRCMTYRKFFKHYRRSRLWTPGLWTQQKCFLAWHHLWASLQGLGSHYRKPIVSGTDPWTNSDTRTIWSTQSWHFRTFIIYDILGLIKKHTLTFWNLATSQPA